MTIPKTFIGYSNIKWLIKELLKMYSAKEVSYFSRKRVNEGIVFYSAVGVDLSYCFTHRNIMSSSEALCHVVALFAAAGYHLNQIQKEKLDNNPPT